MRIEHTIPAGLVESRRVRVLVVGAGGTGSAVVMGLPYLDQAMRAWGHRGGLDVSMMDADAVSETNCVRQPFSLSDVGLNKATVLINRIIFTGLLSAHCSLRSGSAQTFPFALILVPLISPSLSPTLPEPFFKALI